MSEQHNLLAAPACHRCNYHTPSVPASEFVSGVSIATSVSFSVDWQFNAGILIQKYLCAEIHENVRICLCIVYTPLNSTVTAEGSIVRCTCCIPKCSCCYCCCCCQRCSGGRFNVEHFISITYTKNANKHTYTHTYTHIYMRSLRLLLLS